MNLLVYQQKAVMGRSLIAHLERATRWVVPQRFLWNALQKLQNKPHPNLPEGGLCH